MRVTVLGFLLKPLLRYLGYSDIPMNTNIPESVYYLGRSGMQDLAEIHLGYLSTSGWLESRNYNRSFFSGELKPWLTFAATHFLEQLDMTDMKIVEFGGGASTVWFSRRASEVKTYEFDANWAHLLSEQLTDRTNVEIVQPKVNVGVLRAFNADPNSGLDSVSDLDNPFDPFICSAREHLSTADLILIDGGPRNLAMFLASQYAALQAIVIVDNSDTEALREGVVYLLDAGYIEIPFRGLGPLNPYQWITSIFVRDLDSLR